MTSFSFPPWARRVVVLAAGFLVIAVLSAVWLYSSGLRDDLLTPSPFEPDPDLEVIAVGEGRIVLTRSELSQRDGVWGVIGENGYGQVSAIVEVRAEEVERSFRLLDGEVLVGDPVEFDQYAYTGDPETAHGMSFENVFVPGELGLYPAWLIDGDRDTWAVVVHGQGLEERKQALRAIPTLEGARFPILTITYRNNALAPASVTGRYGWGLEEWRDIEAALEFGKAKGADDFVIMGYGMGATITAMFLHESGLLGDVRAVMFDSPVLDLETVADNSGVPSPLLGLVKGLTRVRFGVEWSELDQLERADEFDVPILLMHGSDDAVIPVGVSEAFAEARPDLVTFERFDGARHVQLWNSNPQRYERTVATFLEQVTADAQG